MADKEKILEACKVLAEFCEELNPEGNINICFDKCPIAPGDAYECNIPGIDKDYEFYLENEKRKQ